MKKVLVILGVVLLLSGCGKSNGDDVLKKLNKKISNLKSYHLVGTLDIYRNEEKYSYDVDSSYMDKDYYKVDLINKSNNHKQIIIKNNDGVYVLTPSLNKSFKFQSDWPYNNSQIYLLQPILSDINNDKEKVVEKQDNGFVITSKVNYSTEKDFEKQKVYLDNNSNITKVEIIDSNDNVKMSLNIIDIDYKSNFGEEYFDSNKYVKEEQLEDESVEEKEKTTSKIDNVVYPMYVPIDTYLSSQDVVNTNSGERVILTFNGEEAFTIVQETLSDTNTTNYVYGDPYLILDTVGSITDYSVSWISNGIEYSVMSDTMDIDELLTVAQSISVKTVGK